MTSKGSVSLAFLSSSLVGAGFAVLIGGALVREWGQEKVDDSLRSVLKAGPVSPDQVVRFTNPLTKGNEGALIHSLT